MNRFYVILSSSILSGLPGATFAQQPFAQLGVQVKILTLSNDRYPEFFAHDSLRRIGSVVYNTRFKKINTLLSIDSLSSAPKSDIASRWLSTDPLAAKYASISPYAYVANSPMRLIDPDGRKIVFAQNSDKTAYDRYENNLMLHGTEKEKAELKQLKESDIIYEINVSEGAIHGEGGTKGGRTTFNFESNIVQIQITPDGDLTQALLGDELKTAYQFDNGDYAYIDKGGGSSITAGYDLADEIDTKKSSVSAEQRDGKTIAELKKKYNYKSLDIMQEIENGTLSPDKEAKLGNKGAYAITISGSDVPGEYTKAEAGLKDVQEFGRYNPAKERAAYVKQGDKGRALNVVQPVPAQGKSKK